MIDLCTIFSRNWALPSFQHPSRDSAFSVCESLDHHTNAIHLGHQALSLAPHSSLSKVVTVVTLERAATVLAAPKPKARPCWNAWTVWSVWEVVKMSCSQYVLSVQKRSVPHQFSTQLSCLNLNWNSPNQFASPQLCIRIMINYIYIIWTCTHQFWHTIKSNVYQNGSPNGMAVLGHQWWGHHAFEATT